MLKIVGARDSQDSAGSSSLPLDNEGRVHGSYLKSIA
jgi:hypothetical protein